MAAFAWQALDARGKVRQGVLEGESPRQLRQHLRSEGLVPVSVEEVQGRRARTAGTRGGRERRASVDRRLRPMDLALFTRQLATLLRSRLPLEEALRIVAQQAGRAGQRNLVTAIRSRVAEGMSLADALRQFPRAFPEYYPATVAAGEQSGRLEVVLERLADYAENASTARQKVLLSLLYPALVTLVALAVVIGLVTYVVPEVVKVFERMEQELPLLTRGLIAFSDFLRDYGWILIGLGVLVVLAVRWAYSRPEGRKRIQRQLLHVPLVGRLLRELNVARFARTFGILLGSSVSATEALRVSANVLTSLPIRDALLDAADRVREGSAIGTALYNTGLFPPLMLNMIASGEASGQLVEMLDRAAETQERQMLHAVAALVGLMEPLLILVMGGLVLVIVLAIMLPIFNINQLIQ
jgi:general secretion pathway protein F